MTAHLRFAMVARATALMLLAGIITYMTGCEYNLTSIGPSTMMHVTVTPARYTMETGSSLELTAKVTGFKSDSTVTWSVRDPKLGDLQADGNGAIYTSPDTIQGSSDTVIVQAVSNEDLGKLATCTIIIVPAAPPAQPTILIDPITAQLDPGTSQQFTVTVSNANDPSVTWSIVDGQGTITQSGLYTAPSSVSGVVNATIHATLNEDTSIWAAAEVTVTAPCYWTATQQILGGNCTQAGCHNATDRQEGYDLTKSRDILRMAKARSGSQSKLLYVLTARGEELMPQPPYPALTADQIATIRNWINAGMDTTPCADVNPGSCDTTGVKYSVFIRSTMQNACYGCHAGSRPTGTYDLSTYAGVAAVAHTGQLVGSISHQAPYRAMPDGGAMLDSCSIAKIRAWVNAGAPNN